MVSLEKAIEHGQEKRKEYYGSKKHDKTCRNNGACSYCRDNRLYRHKKRSGDIIDNDKWIEKDSQ